MEDTQYEETGKKVPITMDELMQAVFYRLEMFDKLMGTEEMKNNGAPSYTPYIHPIIYNTRDGRTVEVPRDIQRRAIEEWRSSGSKPKKYDGPPGFSPGLSENKAIHMRDDDMGFESGEYTQLPINEEEVEAEEDLDKQVIVVKDNNYKLLLLVIAAFLVFGFVLHRRGNLRF